jgi:hypothetical protein
MTAEDIKMQRDGLLAARYLRSVGKAAAFAASGAASWPKGLHHSCLILRHLTPRSCQIPRRMRLPR